jgi:hypothetical protein
MMFRKIIDVYSENKMLPVILFGPNFVLVNIEASDRPIHSNHQTFKTVRFY